MDIHVERTREIRYSITGKRLILRVPTGISKEHLMEHIGKMEKWAQQQFAEKPQLVERHQTRLWQDGQTVQVGERTYTLRILRVEASGSSARLHPPGVIHIRLNQRLSDKEADKTVKTLLSRIVANDFYIEICQRVREWNAKTVAKHIAGVQLKYNHSNWGSCSSKGNINISTRLLFAPKEVQDYVILHELAHLAEPNHSDRFWAIVEQYMPHYQEMEKWLKVNGHLCDFR